MNKDILKFVIGRVIYVIGLIIYIAFMKRIYGISAEAFFYALGACFGVMIFCLSDYIS